MLGDHQIVLVDRAVERGRQVVGRRRLGEDAEHVALVHRVERSGEIGVAGEQHPARSRSDLAGLV